MRPYLANAAERRQSPSRVSGISAGNNQACPKKRSFRELAFLNSHYVEVAASEERLELTMNPLLSFNERYLELCQADLPRCLEPRCPYRVIDRAGSLHEKFYIKEKYGGGQKFFSVG